VPSTEDYKQPTTEYSEVKDIPVEFKKIYDGVVEAILEHKFLIHKKL